MVIIYEAQKRDRFGQGFSKSFRSNKKPLCFGSLYSGGAWRFDNPTVVQGGGSKKAEFEASKKLEEAIDEIMSNTHTPVPEKQGSSIPFVDPIGNLYNTIQQYRHYYGSSIPKMMPPAIQNIFNDPFSDKPPPIEEIEEFVKKLAKEIKEKQGSSIPYVPPAMHNIFNDPFSDKPGPTEEEIKEFAQKLAKEIKEKHPTIGSAITDEEIEKIIKHMGSKIPHKFPRSKKNMHSGNGFKYTSLDK
jgi:hypothetical protein